MLPEATVDRFVKVNISFKQTFSVLKSETGFGLTTAATVSESTHPKSEITVNWTLIGPAFKYV